MFVLLLVFVILALTVAFGRTMKQTKEWKYVAHLGSPMIVFVSRHHRVQDLSNITIGQRVSVFVETPIARVIASDILQNKYGLTPMWVTEWRDADLVALLLEQNEQNETLRTMSNESESTHLVTMNLINGGAGFIQESEQAFFQERPHVRKATLDAHASLALYPHLTIDPQMFFYPTVRYRLNLVGRGNLSKDTVQTLRDMSKAAVRQEPFHLQDISRA